MCSVSCSVSNVLRGKSTAGMCVGILLSLLSLVASFRSRWTTTPLSRHFRLRSDFLTQVQVQKVDTQYGAEAITVLTGLEPVRKRPGMYIGTTGPKGLHHLVFEVVDNSIDEALAGHCDSISVSILPDNSVEVVDNGRGIPCAVHPATGKSSLETVLCVLHAGGKFGGDSSGYKVSGGLHGVGISVVNALSESLNVQVVRDGFVHEMSFARGVPVTEMQIRPARSDEPRGTRVVFKPDADIFKATTVFDADVLADRLDELAYLNAGAASSAAITTMADAHDAVCM